MINLRHVLARCVAVLAVLSFPAPVALGAAAECGGIRAADVHAAPPSSAQSAPQGSRSGPGSRPPGPRSGGSPLIGDDRPWPWWNDADVRRELGLTEDTVTRINAIVQERLRAFRGTWDEFQRERGKLGRMLSDPATSEAAFELQVTKVEKLGADLEISRTMMLFRIVRLLRPDQVQKLEDIARRRRR